MKVVAVNGSPRKAWNTAGLLEAALQEARAEGAETTMIHLYALQYTGCRSCFACKRLNASQPARCVLTDELQAVLEQILAADVVLFGSPIYFGDVTAQLRALFERLWFPSLNYDKERTVNYPRNVCCGFVFTMNVEKPELYEPLYRQLSANMERLVGPTSTFILSDTMQFDDYSKYLSTMFDAKHKVEHHQQTFPQKQQEIAQWMSTLLQQAKTL